MQRTLNSLQVGRAFAALAVLFYHTEMTLNMPKYLGRAVLPFFDAGYCGVDYFFVLSGFVMMLVHRKDIGRPDRLANFVWKRFQRIYPPLWVILILVAPVYLLHPAAGGGLHNVLQAVIAAFLVTPIQHESVLAVEWTLRHEVVFYAFCALLIWRPRMAYALGVAWLVLSIVLSLVGSPFPVSFFFSAFNVTFDLGGAAAWLYKGPARLWPASSLATGVLLATGAVLFAACWVMAWQGIVVDKVDGVAPDMAMLRWAFGLGAALLVLGAARLEVASNLTFPAALVFLGEASYSIYLSHFIVVSLGAKLFAALAHRVAVPDLVVFLGTALGALLGGIAFHLLVEKPLVRLLRAVPVPGQITTV